MGLNLIKSDGQQKKLEWEIVRILSKNSPGYDFGVNPKELVIELSDGGFDIVEGDIKRSALKVGHTLVDLGFKEKFTSGKLYRKIYIDHLKKLEYAMLADNDAEYERVKPLIVYIYHNGYDPVNEKLQVIHDKIPEPLRLRVGKWYCQATNKEIEDYLTKCEAEGLISKKLKDVMS